MCDFWNKIDIVPPPINTAKVVVQKEDVIKLREITTDFNKEMENRDLLHKEAAILSRIIYRMKLKFRSDKGFKTMEKVNRSLLRYLNTDVQCDIKNFSETINVDNFSNTGTIYLPSRQMLEHVLVRLQGFAKLFSRIVDSCLIASNYMLERITSGQSWAISLLVLSTISKICDITKNLTKLICNTYQKLYVYNNKLQPTGLKWLPENVILEPNLEKWLDEEWLNENPKINAPVINKSNDNKIFDLIDFEDDLNFQVDNECSKMNSYKKQNPINTFRTDTLKKTGEMHINQSPTNKTVHSMKSNIDFGEPISRNMFEPKKTEKMQIDQSPSNKTIHSMKPVVDFGEPISRNMFDSIKKKPESVSRKNNLEDNEHKSINTEISAAAPRQNNMEVNVAQKISDKFENTKKNNASESVEKSTDVSNIKLKAHAVRFINNKEDLKRFMVKETKYRKKNSPKCLSKKLDDSQWRKFQKLAVKSFKKLNSDEIENSTKLKSKTLKQIKSEMLLLLKHNN